MSNNYYVTLLEEYKNDEDDISLLIKRYDPLIRKYSTINGFFYEDLYNRLVEVTIRLIKKVEIKNQ